MILSRRGAIKLATGFGFSALSVKHAEAQQKSKATKKPPLHEKETDALKYWKSITAGTKEFVVDKNRDVSHEAWWMKFCPQKTKVTKVHFAWGPDKDNILQRWVWTKGVESDEVDLTVLAPYNRIYVYGRCEPWNTHVYLGLCYGEQIACKIMEFDKDEDQDPRKSDTDSWDCS